MGGSVGSTEVMVNSHSALWVFLPINSVDTDPTREVDAILLL